MMLTFKNWIGVKKENVINVKNPKETEKPATYIPIYTIFPVSTPKTSRTSIMEAMNKKEGTTENKEVKKPNNKTLLLLIAIIGVIALFFVMK